MMKIIMMVIGLVVIVLFTPICIDPGLGQGDQGYKHGRLNLHMEEDENVCRKQTGCDANLAARQDHHHNNKFKEKLHPDWIHVAIVACGDRQKETIIAVKAIVLQNSTTQLYFHIFTEDDLKASFNEELQSWPFNAQKKFEYHLYPITYPADRFKEWKNLFKLCATQRLFIPALLPNVDSLLYIDTDILVLTPIQKLWAHFDNFNSTQLAAVAPEHEQRNAGWYNRFARHPYYGELGINSGVMLMNLTRIRQFPWQEHMDKYLTMYRYNITWGDQDLLNVLFHNYPEFVYIYDCSWNYRPDHCMYMSVCKPAEEYGIRVVHGNRGTLHNDKEPVFKAIYDAIVHYNFDDNLAALVEDMKRRLDNTTFQQGRCHAVKHLFTKELIKRLS